MSLNTASALSALWPLSHNHCLLSKWKRMLRVQSLRYMWSLNTVFAKLTHFTATVSIGLQVALYNTTGADSTYSADSRCSTPIQRADSNTDRGQSADRADRAGAVFKDTGIKYLNNRGVHPSPSPPFCLPSLSFPFLHFASFSPSLSFPPVPFSFPSPPL